MSKRVVTVLRVPENLRWRRRRVFLLEVQACMIAGRPRIVLDCSSLRRIDRPALRLLLCCLEEAMKLNGDVKLAALPSGSEQILETTGAVRVFDIYGTTADAVNSFLQPPGTAQRSPASLQLGWAQEDAA